MEEEYKLVDAPGRRSLFDAPQYKPRIRLEVLTSPEIRRILGGTYAISLACIIYTATTHEVVDSAVSRWVLVPILSVGYIYLVFLFLNLCFWECLGLVLREQIWTFLTLCICAVCALEVALHTFQSVPHETVLAARVALQNVLKLLWLLFMDSYWRENIPLCSSFYGWKFLFVFGNVAAEVAVLSIFSRYSTEEMATTWSFYCVFVCWLLWYMRKTKYELSKQEYLQTRTRQLGFRFFCYQSMIVVFSVGVCIAIDASTHKNIISGITFVQHAYMLLLGYVHLPLERDLHQHTIFDELTQGHISFISGQISLQASYEVYQEAPFDSQGSEYSLQWIEAGGWAIPSAVKVLEVLSEEAAGIKVAICSVSAPEMTIVAFRGTANWTNVVIDLTTWRVAPSNFGTGSTTDCLSDHNVLIHRGFWSAYMSIRDRLLAALRRYYQPERKELNTLDGCEEKVTPLDCPIVFTGHSLGGAMATLAALDNTLLRYPLHHMTACFTFGSPRVGSHNFAALFNEKVPDTMRVVFERDFVTDQPKFFCAFKHVGKEILIDARGNCIANPTFVEKAFFDSRTGVIDHSLLSYVKGFNACSSGSARITQEP